jgi:hypothetical protein
MSLFHTKIAVDLKPVLDALPKGAFVHAIEWDKDNGEIIVLWESDRYETGLTVPVLFGTDNLRKHTLPAYVRDRTRKLKPPVLPAVPQSEVVTGAALAKAVPKQNLIITEKAFAAARKAGDELEFWGVESFWKPVDAGHKFTPGFYYRQKPQPPADVQEQPLNVPS